MIRATPGVLFLAKGFLCCCIPYIGGTVIQHFVHQRYNISIPTWAIATVSILSLPITAYVSSLYKAFKDEHKAAAMGAQLVPKVEGGFLNIDALLMMKQAWESGYLSDNWYETFDKYGPVFNFYAFRTNAFATISPEYIKLVLATDFQNYVKGERFQRTMATVLGSGVFNSDGDMWKFHRAITRPAFTRDRISDFEIFDRHAKTAISKLKDRLREGHGVDFQDLMSRFTMDGATEFLFGTSVHSLSVVLPYPHNVNSTTTATRGPDHSGSTTSTAAFSSAFLGALKTVALRERYSRMWPLFEIREDKTQKHMKIVDGYIEPIVKAALEKKKAKKVITEEEQGQKDIQEGETLLDHFVKSTEDPKILKDETLNILIAGRDTTASSLTFAVYLLATHPHVNTCLRQEILEKVGSTRMPNHDDIRGMKYLRAVINETLRLFPPVPFNVRESVNDTTWPNPDPNQKPYFIPGGSKVVYSVFLMHRRKDLWGPDADQFDPDRFLDDRLKTYLTKNPFIFLPFNAGPRICLGQQFAYNEMSFMLVRLLQSFSSVSLDPSSAPADSLPPPEWKGLPGRKGFEQIVPRLHLTMYSQGGLWVKMEEAEGL